ncbi:MAG: TadE/TadG family type IV pilus assembly protein [Gemmataceae bacterium]
MLCRARLERFRRRRGVAAAELAILLPFLAFLFIAAVDFGRIFYFYVTITNCARGGALYASSDATHTSDTTGITNAALADSPNLSPSPTVSSTTGTDGAGNAYVQVTVNYTFQTITNFPGIASSTTLSRSVRMRVAPP